MMGAVETLVRAMQFFPALDPHRSDPVRNTPTAGRMAGFVGFPVSRAEVAEAVALVGVVPRDDSKLDQATKDRILRYWFD